MVYWTQCSIYSSLRFPSIIGTMTESRKVRVREKKGGVGRERSEASSPPALPHELNTNWSAAFRGCIAHPVIRVFPHLSFIAHSYLFSLLLIKGEVQYLPLANHTLFFFFLLYFVRAHLPNIHPRASPLRLRPNCIHPNICMLSNLEEE